MILRMTEDQLEAHRKRLAGAKGSEIRPTARIPFPEAKSKYGAVETRGYASKKEAKRAAELKLLQQAGTITNLREQVRFELIPKQMIDGKCVERAIVYQADFVFEQDGRIVVEDVKGFRTDVYKIKKKLLLFRHGIRIIES